MSIFSKPKPQPSHAERVAALRRAIFDVAKANDIGGRDFEAICEGIAESERRAIAMPTPIHYRPAVYSGNS